MHEKEVYHIEAYRHGVFKGLRTGIEANFFFGGGLNYIIVYLEAHTLPLFLGRLLFKITDPNHKTRSPKKGGRV